VNRICNDLVKLLEPVSMTVRGEFTPRGGIPFWPTAEYRK
jgi:7-cyano-7-deazaguanine reductase